jgi:hypothetical protein
MYAMADTAAMNGGADTLCSLPSPSGAPTCSEHAHIRGLQLGLRMRIMRAWVVHSAEQQTYDATACWQSPIPISTAPAAYTANHIRAVHGVVVVVDLWTK